MIEVHLMDIIWHGHSCFELVSGGYSAVIDPFQDTSVGTAYPHVRLTADAVYISHEDRDHNFREGVTLRNTGKANPFAVTELETYHDIMRGRLRGMNTVRIFAAEGMRVAHLGDLGAWDDALAERLTEKARYHFDAVLCPSLADAVKQAKANSRRGLLVCGGEAAALEAAELLVNN